MISIIIPNYNTPKEWLYKSVISAVNQTYSNIEIIIVDDGSVKPFSGLEKRITDKRIQWVHMKENSGVSSARNYGASLATGDWLAFLDADDWWESDKLELQFDIAKNDNVDWVYSSAYLVSQDGEVVSMLDANYKGDVLKAILSKMIVVGSCSGVIVKKSLFMSLGGFDTKGDVVEDWDLWIRLAKTSEVSFVSKPLVYIRSFSANSRGFNPGKLNRLKRLQEKHWDDIVKFKLKNVAKSHFFSVKARLQYNSKKYISAIYSAFLSIYYSNDFTKLIRAYETIKNKRLYG